MNKQKKNAPDKKDVVAYIPLYHYYIPIFGGCFPTDSFANGNIGSISIIWHMVSTYILNIPEPITH